MNNKQRCDLTEACVLESLLKVFGGGGRGNDISQSGWCLGGVKQEVETAHQANMPFTAIHRTHMHKCSQTVILGCFFFSNNILMYLIFCIERYSVIHIEDKSKKKKCLVSKTCSYIWSSTDMFCPSLLNLTELASSHQLTSVTHKYTNIILIPVAHWHMIH